MLRVLIADDESKVCQLIEKLVDWGALGMEVVAVAENGIEALEKIKEFYPDIVITDIRMPGYDGMDLIRLGKEEAPKAEFVIISGYRHFEYAQMAIRYGVNAYLLKPIRKDELTETLKRLSAHFKEQTEQLSLEEKRQRAIRLHKSTISTKILSKVFLFSYIILSPRFYLTYYNIEPVLIPYFSMNFDIILPEKCRHTPNYSTIDFPFAKDKFH